MFILRRSFTMIFDKKYLTTLVTGFLPAVFLSSCTGSEHISEPIFSRGEKASETVFTGTAYVKMLVPDTDSIYNNQVYDVVFEAGARNNWHSHPGGQILLVTNGKGWYQERGKQARFLQKGDVVAIPPDVEHWHGAAKDSDFTHIGISPNTQKGGAVWLEPVSDEEYKKVGQ
jgi:quercetin dioxygenase-like cupin family protein